VVDLKAPAATGESEDSHETHSFALRHERGHPAKVHPVAGALLYRQYGFLTRFVLRMISKQKGGDTDTSRDYEYTD
jgi:menaquinone-dependent protoporphyrinogen oxidase